MSAVVSTAVTSHPWPHVRPAPPRSRPRRRRPLRRRLRRRRPRRKRRPPRRRPPRGPPAKTRTRTGAQPDRGRLPTGARRVAGPRPRRRRDLPRHRARCQGARPRAPQGRRSRCCCSASRWSSRRAPGPTCSGPVGDLVEMLVTGAFGRLDLLVPILLGVIAVRLIRHPEQPEANGRIVIGLSALVVGVLGQVHIACGSPARSDGMQAMRDAGGLIGWARLHPADVHRGRRPRRARCWCCSRSSACWSSPPRRSTRSRSGCGSLGRKLGIVQDAVRPRTPSARTRSDHDGQWREAPARALPRRPQVAATAYDPDGAEQDALTKRRSRPRRSGGAARPEPADGRRWTWPPPPPPRWTARCCTGCSPRRWSPT